MGGDDKAFHEHRGIQLIDRALRVCASQSAVWVASSRSADRYARRGIATIPDALPGFAGPLSGLLAGFQKRQAGVLLSIPVDLLGPEQADMEHLLHSLSATQRCCYALIGDRKQPLFAAWRVDCELIEHAHRRLLAGRGSVFKFQDEIGAQPVDFGPRAETWQNLNQVNP